MDLFFPFSFLFSPFFLFSLSTRVFAETPLHVYFVLPVARQGQSSRYLKHEDKLRVNQSVFLSPVWRDSFQTTYGVIRNKALRATGSDYYSAVREKKHFRKRV